jgi:hypothetical protein
LKKLELLSGEEVILDDEDYERFKNVSWRMHSGGYAVRSAYINKKNLSIRMHREIVGAKPGEYVDHINLNKLDNRRSNLRIATNAQNAWNQSKRPDNTSGYKGVGFRKDKNKYRAEIKKDYRSYHLGYFDNKHDAARMYNFWAKDMFGEFARLNVINEEEIS